MPQTTEKLSPQARSTIKIVFLTLFLDLVGFSIIFPLFPALIDHYWTLNPDNYLLTLILGLMSRITEWGGVSETVSPVVLFGGILGALYSLLQFVCTPFWGALSDRIGRRPVLLISVFGTAAGYLIWIFSGSFTLLLLSRVVTGVMGGNISTATAAVGDVTSEKTRSRGMAFVGIAFSTGFIVGPALGGVCSLLRLDQIIPQGAVYGLNPFSAAAGLAFVLALLNLFFIAKTFRETLPPQRRGHGRQFRTANPLVLFRPLPEKGINLINLTNFFFLAAFSGMEFTLTFLAVERLAYAPLDNGIMFVFIGIVMAVVQGSYVRRKAHQVGEKRLVLMGMAAVIPGLVILSVSQANPSLYLGLTFLAVGAAMIIPCLTALVSLIASPKTQGRAIGTFRSLGSLARVIGPFAASLLYWKLGATTAYLLGAVLILIPILLAANIPQPTTQAQSRLTPQPSSI